MSFNYIPLYTNTDSCKNDELLMKQHLNQIYGTQVEGDRHMGFDLQTFYEQIFGMAELVHTTTLRNGTVSQLFESGNVSFLVFIDVHEHRVARIDIHNKL